MKARTSRAWKATRDSTAVAWLLPGLRERLEGLRFPLPLRDGCRTSSSSSLLDVESDEPEEPDDVDEAELKSELEVLSASPEPSSSITARRLIPPVSGVYAWLVSSFRVVVGIALDRGRAGDVVS